MQPSPVDTQERVTPVAAGDTPEFTIALDMAAMDIGANMHRARIKNKREAAAVLTRPTAS